MRFTLLLSALAQMLLIEATLAAQCNADNCARAAAGTFRGLHSAHLASCSSFQQCTVTPAAATVTSTVTYTPPIQTETFTFTTVTELDVIASTVTVAPPYPRRAEAVAPPAGAVTRCGAAIPSFASACSSAARYESACSCAGVTQHYFTAATPTTTRTVTLVIPVPLEVVGATAFTTVTSVSLTTVTAHPYSTG